MTKTSSNNSGTLAIEVSELRKSYGEVVAVRGVSFEASAGEVFCLLGPNGAGKTTTVEMLEGCRARPAMCGCSGWTAPTVSVSSVSGWASCSSRPARRPT